MTEQQKDWWLKEHTDKIISQKDAYMEISELISMFSPSTGRSLDDRTKLVDILQKMEINEITVEEAINQAREVYSNREIIAE